jgi:hypothetical protein
MNPRGFNDLVVFERITQLSREAERERLARLVRSERRGSKAARRIGSARWRGWVQRVRTVPTRPSLRSPLRVPELPGRGDRS